VVDSLEIQTNSLLESIKKKANYKEMKRVLGQKLNIEDIEKVISSYIDNIDLTSILDRLEDLENRDIKPANKISKIPKANNTLEKNIKVLMTNLNMLQEELLKKANVDDLIPVLEKKLGKHSI
jgi:archaellum component FlaC